MNVKKSVINVVKNEYVYALINRFINIGIGVIQSILVARYLGAELQGVNAYISSITSIASIVFTFGMHQAYPYYRRKLEKENFYDDYVSLTVVLYSIYIIVCLIIALVTPFSLPLKAAILLTPLLGYSRVVAYVALIEHPNRRNTVWTIIHIAEMVYVLVLWMFTTRGVYWAISILLFADFIKCVVYTRMLKFSFRIHKGLIDVLLRLVKFGFFPMLALLMTTLNYKIDVLMLHQYNHITDAMLGVYSIGIALSNRIVLIPDTLKGILVSKLTKGAGSDEVARVSRLGFWASFLLCFLVFIFGKWAIRVLYGAEYSDAYLVIIITAAGVLAISYFKLIAQYNIVNRKQVLNVAMLSIAIVVDVVLNLLFIPRWGINGAAAATSIGNFVCGVVFIIYFCKNTGVKVSEMLLIQKKDMDILTSIFRTKRS